MNLEVKAQINPGDFVFLLGGHDLEKAKIKNILKAKGIDFHDNNLSWGVKPSAYKDRFDELHTFVGIKLISDIPPPRYYIENDHHTEKCNKHSSKEQVIVENYLNYLKHINYQLFKTNG